MTEPTPPAKRSIAGAVRLTHLGLWAEQLTRAFWPVWTALFLGVAIWSSGVLPGPWELPAIGVAALTALIFLVKGLWHFRAPTRADALSRLDATLPGRPIATLTDAMAVGGTDPQAAAVWAAHRRRMADRLAAAKPVPGDLRVARSDPYALRYIAVLLAAIGLLFGTLWRVPEVPQLPGVGQQIATGPAWEGWLEPPRYTGLPTLYLNELPPGTVDVPEGTRVTLRLYGEVDTLAVRETVSGQTDAQPSAPLQDFVVTRSGTLTIEGGEDAPLWTLTATPDAAPEIAIAGAAVFEFPDQSTLPWTARDDYGVTSAEITIALDAEGTDRRHGLRIEPEPRDPLTLDMALPISGDRAEVAETFRAKLTEHPLADIPVTITLSATDAAGQVGTVTDRITLPGRAFYDPIAAALIEQRRDLNWSRANRTRVSRLLKAATWNADSTWNAPTAYLITRMAIRRLDAGPLTLEARDEITEMLWQAATRIEDGSLDSALARLREAQERLAEAIRQGASPEEISRLMAEMRNAMDDYTRQLAQQQGQQDQQQQAQGETQDVTPDMLDQMMQRIEELMQQGRTAEAQELLRQLQEMMENMQVTQGQGSGQGQPSAGEQAMDELRDQLRDQQDLSDEAFRQLQEQFGQDGQQGQQPGQQPGQGQQQGQGQGQQQGQQPGQGQAGQGGQSRQSREPGQGSGQGDPSDRPGQGGGGSAQDLAERQEALRRGLDALRRTLPGAGTEAGDAAREALGRAEGAMEDAEQDLADGNLGGALDDQARAMDALRDGMQQLGRALAGEPRDGQDSGRAGDANGRAGRADTRDPLGRQSGEGGQLNRGDGLGDVPGGTQRRARDLQDEIRRRSGEQDRPQIELDYLRRLLDRF